MRGVGYEYTRLNPRVPGMSIWAQILILLPERVGYLGMITCGVQSPGTYTPTKRKAYARRQCQACRRYDDAAGDETHTWHISLMIMG